MLFRYVCFGKTNLQCDLRKEEKRQETAKTLPHEKKEAAIITVTDNILTNTLTIISIEIFAL